jgi:hypothetical protein
VHRRKRPELAARVNAADRSVPLPPVNLPLKPICFPSPRE